MFLICSSTHLIQIQILYNKQNIDKQVTYENIVKYSKYEMYEQSKSKKNLALLDKYNSVTTNRISHFTEKNT